MQQSAMKILLKKLASLRLTLVGMGMLGVLAFAGSRSPAIDVAYTAIPIALLTCNLLAAILVNRSFRTQSGLLMFHVGLLLVFALIGITVLTRFDGHVEVVQGVSFDARSVEIAERGWLHRGNLSEVQFSQGDIQVDYLPNLVRQATRSTITYPGDADTTSNVTVGDKRGAEFEGYRFLATFNKGFALILRWQGDDGSTAYGSIHFPSFPLYDWNQVAEWVTPAGQKLEMKIEFAEPLVQSDSRWVLQRPRVPYVVHANSTDLSPVVVRNGDSVDVDGGSVRIEDLRLWMAYRIDYYPYLPWMFVAAMLAIGGLVVHFGSRYLPSRKTAASETAEVANAFVAGA